MSRYRDTIGAALTDTTVVTDDGSHNDVGRGRPSVRGRPSLSHVVLRPLPTDPNRYRTRYIALVGEAVGTDVDEE